MRITYFNSFRLAKNIPDLVRGFDRARSEFEKLKVESKIELDKLKNIGYGSSVDRENKGQLAVTLGINFENKNDEDLEAIEAEINKTKKSYL